MTNSPPRMFYQPIFDDRHHDWQRVNRYELDGFDVTELWGGSSATAARDLKNVKLYVTPGRPTDYMANPLSLQICSDRLIQGVAALIGADVQSFDAPLVDANTKMPISSYRFLNVVRRVASLDAEKSVVSHRNDGTGRISAVYRVSIDAARVPADVHIFRLKEFFPIVVVSQEFVDALLISGVRGIMFAQCGPELRAAGP